MKTFLLLPAICACVNGINEVNYDDEQTVLLEDDIEWTSNWYSYLLSTESLSQRKVFDIWKYEFKLNLNKFIVENDPNSIEREWEAAVEKIQRNIQAKSMEFHLMYLMLIELQENPNKLARGKCVNVSVNNLILKLIELPSTSIKDEDVSDLLNEECSDSIPPYDRELIKIMMIRCVALTEEQSSEKMWKEHIFPIYAYFLLKYRTNIWNQEHGMIRYLQARFKGMKGGILKHNYRQFLLGLAYMK